MPRALLFVLLSACIVFGQDEAPSAQSFVRRGSSRGEDTNDTPTLVKECSHRTAASVLGNYIYFDGGELAQEPYNDWRYNNPGEWDSGVQLLR